MTLTLIAAAAENNALGKNNRMIWHLPDDFKRFKQLTSGHHIIMGRKTFESLPGMLTNRTHVIITRQNDFKAEGCIVANSLDEAIKACAGDDEVFIIGGGEIYRQAIDRADEIELTRVFGVSPEADAFFPDINPEHWQLDKEVFHPKDEKHKYDMAFQTYIRR
jgi:dihydrofolate reductase